MTRLLTTLMMIALVALPCLAVENQGDLLVEVISEESDAPIAGALVRVLTRSGSRLIASGTTDASGMLRLKNIEEGRYQVEVSHPDLPGDDGAVVTIAAATDPR